MALYDDENNLLDIKVDMGYDDLTYDTLVFLSRFKRLTIFLDERTKDSSFDNNLQTLSLQSSSL